jgi:uncharacterized protein YigA (DUF484 family)
MTRKTNDPVPDESDHADPAGDDPAGVDAESVAAYLGRNPDFFTTRADLLAGLEAPSRWTGDGIVDMQRYLVERHRGEIDDLRNCAQEVIETSRSNMSVQTRTHAAVLAMISASGADALFRVIADDLPLLLDVDVVAMGFEESESPPAAIRSADVRRLAAGAVDTLLGRDQNVRLFREIKDDGTIFGSASGLVRSAALARLRGGRRVPTGLIALGSRGAVFRPSQGTELIGFLARVTESCLYRLAGQSV